jgi:hypothetical protein
MKDIFQRITVWQLVLLVALPMDGLVAAERVSLYARAEKPVPVLNTADFRAVFGGTDGKTLPKDASGLIRAVEFIALPGTAFTIVGSQRRGDALIYWVRTREYPSQEGGLFIDSRFVKTSAVPFPERMKKMPSARTILERMLANEGVPYVWGGNLARGIPELLQYYPPSGNVSLKERALWTLKGLDCSGLLYEAAEGATPRNTSDLVTYGRPVAIEGLSAREIAARLKPLDLIVWKGHVIIVLDKQRTIESCLGCSERGGVTVRDLSKVLNEVMHTRKPVNRFPAKSGKAFVIRRWYPG